MQQLNAMPDLLYHGKPFGFPPPLSHLIRSTSENNFTLLTVSGSSPEYRQIMANLAKSGFFLAGLNGTIG
jgi:hypothetical protein